MENKIKGYANDALERDLKEKFIELVSEHSNGRWATNTLEYELETNNLFGYHEMDDDDKYVVYVFLKSLRNLFGEKHHTDL